MNFDNYPAFRTKVQQMIEGDEISNTFSVGVLDTIIGLAETMVYHDLRASTMEASLSLPVTNNTVTLPADILELDNIYFDPTRPIQIVPLERLERLSPASPSGNTVYASRIADTLQFWPIADGTTLLGTYFQRPPDLVNGLHTTFVRYPECYVYASLVKSAAFLGMDARIPVWRSQYDEAMKQANRDESLRAFGGSKLRVRTS